MKMDSYMLETAIPSSGSVGEARDLFLQDLRSWAGACMLDIAHTTIDNHDQATLCTSWEVLHGTQACDGLLPWLKEHRDAIQAHYERVGLWHHGYWKEQEAHHGTEHFDLFLASLWRMDPNDEKTIQQFIDAAEHIGNWVEGIPAWFDWEHGVFRSMFLGTEVVGDDAAASINIPDHLRCVNLCLIAHRMTGEARFLELARAHGGHWSKAILQGDSLPVALDQQGQGVFELEGETEVAYRKFAGMAPAQLDQLGRAENILASNGAWTFLELASLTNEDHYLQAAERILDPLVDCLPDPDAGCVVAALWDYEQRTGTNRYTNALREALAPMASSSLETICMTPVVNREAQPRGAGKRRDMPMWKHGGQPRQSSPVHLAHWALLENDSNAAIRALDLGRAMFRLGRQTYPHGRHHGCSARTVSAIARGHGRDNHTGVITGVLKPLMQLEP